MKRYEEIYVIQYYNEANPFDYRFHTHTTIRFKIEKECTKL